MTKADSIEALEKLWEVENTRRANGGWWALSGFNIQFLISLTIFFRNYFEEDYHDLEASVESVSDFSLGTNGRTEFFQIKRTLNKASLGSAVREAYEILKICTPGLAAKVTFRLGYERIERVVGLSELEHSDVFTPGEQFDPRLLDAAIARYDAVAPIVQFADPLTNLKLLFLSAGLRDPVGIVKRSIGSLMIAFNGEDKTAKKTALLDLISEIERARRPLSEVERHGKLWLDEDLRQRKMLKTHEVTIGTRPTLTELTNGFYKPRAVLVRIPMMPATYSDAKPATHSEFIPATIPT